MAGQVGRPEKNTVDYFPHYVTEDRTVAILEHKFGAEGYAGYYKLLELIGDTKLYRVGFNKPEDKYYALHRVGLEEEEFIKMIELLISIGKVDSELWGNEKVIWIDDFVNSLKPVYFNRKKPLPTKDGIVSTSNNSISTSRNSQYSKGKERKGEESEAEDMTSTPQFDLESYSKQHPTLDVELSFKKYKLHCEENNKSPSDLGFNVWVKTDINNGWNQKIASKVDKSNKFVTLYCPNGHMEKQADKNRQWDNFCDTCKESMIEKYEMKHNKAAVKQGKSGDM